MDEREIFIQTQQALGRVVAKIKDEQLGMEMPPTFIRRGQEKVTLREIINYHTYDDAWVPDTLSGKTMEEVGKDKFDGDLLGDDPRASYSRYASKASEAVRNLDDLDRKVHLTYGLFTAKEYLQHITWFRASRTKDLAEVIGVEGKLPDDLVQKLYDLYQPHAEEWRKMGVFKEALEVPADADIQTKFWAMTGRRV